jgi:hypothetical protein
MWTNAHTSRTLIGMRQHTSSSHSPEQQTACEVLQAERAGHAIKFYEFYVDNYTDVTWTVYGDCRTNQIALVASKGALAIGVTEASLALRPPMKDRIFGMPMEDHQLVSKLLPKLCLLCCGELRADSK